MTTYIGIDVAKDSLSVAVPKLDGGWKLAQYPNSPDGIRAFLSQLPDQPHCVLEATAAADRWLLLGFGDLYAHPSQGDNFSH